jgi:prepilin-type N-terminal cleavage/methylation domain-containing protein
MRKNSVTTAITRPHRDLAPGRAQGAKARRGFTLVEMLITLALSVLLIGALIGLYRGYFDLFNAQQGLGTLGTTSGDALSEIEQLTRQASRVLASKTISGTTYTSGSDTLVLELPSVDAGGSAISGTFDYVAFYVSGADLYRRIDADAASARTDGAKKLGGALSSLAFEYDAASPADASEVSVDIVFASQNGHANTSFRVQEELWLRNK